MRTVPKKGANYTITEVLQILDFAQQHLQNQPDDVNVVKSLKFWRAVEKKQLIPD